MTIPSPNVVEGERGSSDPAPFPATSEPSSVMEGNSTFQQSSPDHRRDPYIEQEESTDGIHNNNDNNKDNGPILPIVCWSVALVVALASQAALNHASGVPFGTGEGIVADTVLRVVSLRYIYPWRYGGSKRGRRGIICCFYCWLCWFCCCSKRQNNNDENGEEDAVGATSVNDSSRRVVAMNHNDGDGIYRPVSGEDEDDNQDPADRPVQDATDQLNDLSAAAAAPVRLWYLDRVKVFLTVLVVSHHATCAMGGAPKAWFFSIGAVGDPGEDDSDADHVEEHAHSYYPLYRAMASTFLGWNQSYFMALFFAISAYLTPDSFERKGRSRTQFLKDRSKRYLLPAYLMTFLFNPLLSWLSYSFAQHQSTVVSLSSSTDEFDSEPSSASDQDKVGYIYAPNPAHCWFLFWLLLLNWVFISFQKTKESVEEAAGASPSRNPDVNDTYPESSNNTRSDRFSLDMEHNGSTTLNIDYTRNSKPPAPFPSMWKRQLVGGFLICGLGMWIVVALLYPSPSFATLPLSLGSLTCDIFLFYMGIQAKRHGWLDCNNAQDSSANHSSSQSEHLLATDQQEPPRRRRSLLLRDRLGVSVWILRTSVILEVILVYLCMSNMAQSPLVFAVLGFGFAGMVTVDMSTAVLEYFQSHWNVPPGRFGRFLMDSAYTVYLLHPFVVVGCTMAFVYVYNNVLFPADPILFESGKVYSTTVLSGPADGELVLSVGWVLVNITSQLLIWPLAWCVKQLPGVKKIL